MQGKIQLAPGLADLLENPLHLALGLNVHGQKDRGA